MLWPHTGSTAAFSGANVPPSTTPSVLSQPARDTAAGPPQMRTLRNREADRQAQPRSRGQQVAGQDRLGSSPTVDGGPEDRGPGLTGSTSTREEGAASQRLGPCRRAAEDQASARRGQDHLPWVPATHPMHPRVSGRHLQFLLATACQA